MARPFLVALCLVASTALFAGACDDSNPGVSQNTDVTEDAAPADATDDAIDDSAPTDVAGDEAPPSDIAPSDTDPTDAPPADVAPTDVAPEVIIPPKNPTGNALELTVEPFAVGPGVERQVCKTINVPEGIDVVKVVAQMEGISHHFNLYKVIDDTAFDPVTPDEATVKDCSPASEQLAGDAAYIFGSATPERTFETPEGVAIRLEPGQRLILEQHVINYTPNEIMGGVSAQLYEVADPTTIDHYADIMWFNWMGIFLLPGQETSGGTTCTVPYDVNVIGVMSHFHELGTLFEVQRVAGGQVMETIYTDDDWAHPKYQEYADPVHLQAGDGLKWTCTWNNTTGGLVTFGQNSTDEMCIAFALAYPTETKAGPPISCNEFL